MRKLYPVLVGFSFSFMSIIVNTWGFILPYIASKVNSIVEGSWSRVHIHICQQHIWTDYFWWFDKKQSCQTFVFRTSQPFLDFVNHSLFQLASLLYHLFVFSWQTAWQCCALEHYWLVLMTNTFGFCWSFWWVITTKKNLHIFYRFLTQGSQLVRYFGQTSFRFW